MGLRHRTAVSMIRMQRRQAEASGQRVTGKSSSRARNVSFSQIDPAASHRYSRTNAPLLRHDQEESLRLLQRLRQALHPLTNESVQVSREYETIQDELSRLSQHRTQQKGPTVTEVWDDRDAPYPFASSESPDSLPYRTIKIATHETHAIERLDVTPLDLSAYRQVFQETPTPARNLTLVTSEPTPAPQAKDLLMGEEVELSDATANLTQQSLEARGPNSKRITISPEVALSLLDT